MAGRKVTTREAKQVDAQDPAVVVPSLDGATRATHPKLFWPEAEPLPEKWRRDFHPCERCRRILTAHRRQAVVALAKRGKKVHLACRACGHGWTMEAA